MHTAAYDAAKAKVKASEASLLNAKIEHGYTRVYAPFNGVVGISNVRVGDYVSRARWIFGTHYDFQYRWRKSSISDQ